jgi:large subunit ribosomal protein L23
MKKWEIIKAPIITEKSNNLIESNNQYTFKVALDANKVEIKAAVEAIFNVKVEDIQTVRVLPKYRKVGRYEGYRSAYKKAICRLAKDDKIDAFNV